MSANSYHSLVNRRSLTGFAVIELALFVLANVTAKNASHPGTVSQVFWVAFLIGVVVLLAVGVAALIRSRRTVA